MDTTADALAFHNKASSDPLRLNVLRILSEGSFGVLELCQLFAIKQSSMSHHLKILLNAGLVTTRREGNTIFYRRALIAQDMPWAELTRALFRTLDEQALSKTTSERLQTLFAERANSSAEFFNKHADDFREQQDLIASHAQYGETLEELTMQFGGEEYQHALEIGPGEGAFLPALSQHFRKVTGLDVSEAMLEKAGLLINEQGLNNVSLMEGDTSSAIREGIQADFITCNMVLHHVPSPKDIFIDSSELLSDEGCLLITDLCAHDQNWARESCGDLWLGFAPEDLTGWAAEAGLEEIQSQYSGLRNGFQIQFRLFRKQANRSITPLLKH